MFRELVTKGDNSNKLNKRGKMMTNYWGWRKCDRCLATVFAEREFCDCGGKLVLNVS